MVVSGNPYTDIILALRLAPTWYNVQWVIIMWVATDGEAVHISGWCLILTGHKFNYRMAADQVFLDASQGKLLTLEFVFPIGPSEFESVDL